METNGNQILSSIMSAQDIEETKTKLEKIGAEGTKAREVAYDFMKLAVMANSFRFHNQKNLVEYCACAEQFLYQLKAVKETHKFTNNRISSGMIWLKELGFDYTYGGLDIAIVGKDAFEVLNKRSEYFAIETEKLKKAQGAQKRDKRSETEYTPHLND